MWVFGIVGMFVAAFATAVIAERKGQDGLPWFLVGLLAPVLGVVIAAVVLRRPAGAGLDDELPTAAEAATASPVARALPETAGATAKDLSVATGMAERATLAHLEALRVLGFASQGADGRWYRTSNFVAPASP